MYSKRVFKIALIFLATLLLYGLQSTTAQAQSGNIDWDGWSFEYEIGNYFDGLAIKNVTFQGKEIMGRGNFPAMPVYYNNNECGPYLDRLDNDLVSVPWANNARVVSREFTSGGEQWYELGIRQFIGQYDIYQVWYFNGDGIINAHLFSRGLQCRVYHEHWPHWRFDFDIAGSGNDQILRQTSSGLEVYNREFNVKATSAVNHGWVVRDTVTNDSVAISFDSGEWTPSGSIEPATYYAKNRVAGRAYNDGEQKWHTSGHSSLPDYWNDGAGRIGYANGENINNTDVVLWYSGYLPHYASEGEDLWHSTGVRITVQEGEPAATPTSGPSPTPTSTPTPSPTLVPGASVAIQNVDYGRYLQEDSSNNVRTSSSISQWELVVTGTRNGNDVVYIRNVQSGRNVDYDDGNVVDTSTGTSADKQWEMMPQSNGTYLIRNISSGRYLDADTSSNYNVNTSSTAAADDYWRIINNNPPPPENTPTNTPISTPTSTPESTPTSTPTPGTSTELIGTGFSGGANGFSYRDNTFRNTNQGAYASGSHITSGAYNGSAGLRVRLGGLDNDDIDNMSGGWRADFNLASATSIRLFFRYNLTQDSEYESNEYAQVMASVDGVLYGSNGNDYIQQINGNGNGGSDLSTGWQTYSVNLGTLPAGSHTLIIGGFSNRKTYNNELTTLLIDNVSVTTNP